MCGVLTIFLLSFIVIEQKTAFDLRVINWSSDWSSSDLPIGKPGKPRLFSRVNIDILQPSLESLESRRVEASAFYRSFKRVGGQRTKFLVIHRTERRSDDPHIRWQQTVGLKAEKRW